MRFLVAEKLGPHKFKTPEGYLICTDAILSRTGKQEYKRCELFGDACEDPDKIVNVERTDDEVFSDKAMASFENKPVCIEHPDHDVNAENHNELAVGFVRDIHKGEDNGKPVMMGTLVITDKDAVEAVESGEYKELSCGYDCDIDDDSEPCQRNIRGNHVALCKQGRAGIARIVDSVGDMAKLSADESATLKAMIEGGAGKRLYERLSYDKPVTIHLTQEDKELLRWHRDENQYLTNKEKTLLKKLVGDRKVNDVNELTKFKIALRNISKMYSNDPGIEYVTSVLRNLGYEVTVDSIDGWRENKNVPGEHIKKYRMNITLDGKEHHFIVILYADMGVWKVKEINAYMLDSMKDNLELPEEEDSEFLFRDAYGKEIFVINWDGNNQFMVIYEDRELLMNRRDVEMLLDKKGAKFSRVIKDTIKQGDSMKDIQATKTPGTDKIIYVMQSDIDKNLYFYIGKTFAMKEGAWGYTKFEMGDDTPEKIKGELARNGWHQVASGPARVIDMNDERLIRRTELKVGMNIRWKHHGEQYEGRIKRVEQNGSYTKVDYENKRGIGASFAFENEPISTADSWAEVEEENYNKANKPVGAKDAEHEYELVAEKYGPGNVSKKISVFATSELDAINYAKKKLGKEWRVIEHARRLDSKAKDEVEKNFKIYVKNAFGAYKVVDWPAVSKEAAVKEFLEANPAYRNKGIIEARDSVSDSKKEQLFTIEYEQNGVTYVRKVRASSIEDAISKVKDDAYKVVIFTNQVLNELGKNNSIGKYDRVVQAMRSLYSESLLPDDELKTLIRKKVPEYIKKYVKE